MTGWEERQRWKDPSLSLISSQLVWHRWWTSHIAIVARLGITWLLCQSHRLWPSVGVPFWIDILRYFILGCEHSLEAFSGSDSPWGRFCFSGESVIHWTVTLMSVILRVWPVSQSLTQTHWISTASVGMGHGQDVVHCSPASVHLRGELMCVSLSCLSGSESERKVTSGSRWQCLLMGAHRTASDAAGASADVGCCVVSNRFVLSSLSKAHGQASVPQAE